MPNKDGNCVKYFSIGAIDNAQEIFNLNLGYFDKSWHLSVTNSVRSVAQVRWFVSPTNNFKLIAVKLDICLFVNFYKKYSAGYAHSPTGTPPIDSCACTLMTGAA